MMLLCCDLKQFVKLALQVVNQIGRRVIHGEKVPANLLTIARKQLP